MLSNTTDKNIERTWSCKCGQVTASLAGKPVLEFNCHCHSCVAGAKFIADKTNHSGIPMIDETHGGSCPSAYKASQVEFCDGCLSDAETGTSRLKFVRLGEAGEAWRSYTTCCGTQMTQCVMGGLIVLNRNGIRNEDGSKYKPKKLPLNIQKGVAFEPSKVPEPNHETAPASYVPLFMWPAINPFGKKLTQKELFPDKSETEMVPITWE